MALETVTYQHRGLDGTLIQTYSDVVALRRATDGTELAAGANARASRDHVRWHVKASSLAVRPLKGGRIVSGEDGTTWELERNANVETLASRYECECVKVAG